MSSNYYEPLDTVAAMQALGGSSSTVLHVMVLETAAYLGGPYDWDATSTATPVTGLIYQATGVTTGRWIKNAGLYVIDRVTPAMWGASIASDASGAIQSAIDAGQGFIPVELSPGICDPSLPIIRVSGQITFRTPQTCFDGKNIPVGPSVNGDGLGVFQLKTGSRVRIRDLFIDADRDYTWAAALHWYTNDLSLYYPGFATLENLTTKYGPIGVAVGALPTQYDHGDPDWGIFPGNTVQDNGIAVNAPVSESVIANLQQYGCIKGIWMAQTNGKITVTGSTISGSTNEWAEESYDPDEVCALAMRASSSINISASSIENIISPHDAGRLLDLWDASQTFITNSVVETKVPIWIQDSAQLYLGYLSDFAFNTDRAGFQIDADSDGILRIESCPIGRTAGSSYALVECRDGFEGDRSAALNFNCSFEGIEFQNLAFRSGTSGLYVPLARGIRCALTDCTMTSLDEGETVSRVLLDDGDDLLSNAVDTTGFLAGNASDSHWDFAGAGNWSSDDTILPTICQETVSAAIQLDADGTVAQITSALMPVSQEKAYILRAYFRGDGSEDTIGVRVYTYDFAGNSLAGPGSVTLYEGPASTFLEDEWEPVMFLFVAPLNCAKVKVSFYVVDDCVLSILNPSFR